MSSPKGMPSRTRESLGDGVEFENSSGLEATLLRADLPGDGETLGVVVAKASGVFDHTGRMELDLATRVPICFEPTAHEFGQIPADTAIRKDGMDVLALGRAYHPELEGGTESRVVVRVDAQARELAVFGERHWYRTPMDTWAISEPEPFSLMELTWDNCFGGESWDEEIEDVSHPRNPAGKGFIASAEAIEDTALPNIEDPQQLIQSWQDQPRPCNIAPAPKHLAFEPAADWQGMDDVPRPYRVPEALWNDAVPRFRFHDVKAGSHVLLMGMSEAALSAVVPPFRLTARVLLGTHASDIELVPDTLLFFPDARRCVFSWRCNFRYRFAPKQVRRVVLQRQ